MRPEFNLDPEVDIEDIEIPESAPQLNIVPQMEHSITECGLLHPITITPNYNPTKPGAAPYKLVAGLARLLAAQKKGWATIPAVVVSGDSAHLDCVAVQENLVRRKLTRLDQSLLLDRWQTAYEKLHPETKKGGDASKKKESENLSFCQYAAERTPYEVRSIQRLIQIANGLDDEVIDLLKAADPSIKLAKIADHQASLQLLVNEFKHNTKLQKPAVLQSHGNPKKLQLVIEELKREELKKQACEWVKENITLLNLDFREVGDKVPDHGVDLVLTDPPWPKEYVHLGEPLGAFVDRVLKPGGAVAMMLGQATQLPFLELVRKQLTDEKYHWWEFAYLYKNSTATVVHYVNVATKWKPIWVAVKAGGNHHSVIPDLIKETQGTIEGGGKDKTYDEWGQSVDGFQKFVEYLTKPGGLVVDPFVGGGATAAAALRTARKFIGSDIDEDCIKMTRLHLQHEEEKQGATKAAAALDSAFASETPVDEPPTVKDGMTEVDMVEEDQEALSFLDEVPEEAEDPDDEPDPTT